MPPSRLVWIDTETTGLDPIKDQLLEIAVGVTDANFEVLDTATYVLPCLDLEDVYNKTSPYVQEMHTKNGLWADVHEKNFALPTEAGSALDSWSAQLAILIELRSEIEQEILGLLAKHGIFEGSRVKCHGYNPAFDLGFLAVNMPRLHKVFDHNKGDVRALEHFCLLWGLEKHKPVNHNHRALDDLLDEIEAAKHYRRELSVG